MADKTYIIYHKIMEHKVSYNINIMSNCTIIINLGNRLNNKPTQLSEDVTPPRDRSPDLIL